MINYKGMNRFILIILVLFCLFASIQVYGGDATGIAQSIPLEESMTELSLQVQQDSIRKDTTKLFFVTTDDFDNEFENIDKYCDLKQWIEYLEVTYEHKEIIISTISLIVIIVSLLIYLISIIIAKCSNCKNQSEEKSTSKSIISTLIQVILITTIIMIGVLSDSSWSHLVLIILCVIALEKYNPGLLTIFTKAAAALHGNPLDLTPSTQKELDQKRQAEALEEEYIEDTQNTATDESVKEEQNSDNAEVREETVERRKVNFKEILHSRVQEYSKVEQLALQYLEEEYPNLQKSVRLRINSHDRIDLDGLVQNIDSNIIVEIKFCRSVHPIKYNLNKLHEVAKYIFHRTGKITEVLLFVVTESDDLKQKLENLYRQPFQQTNLLQVRVHTLKELEQSISKQQ